ncbi:MAG: phosphate acyltransferase PlsX, partial [Oscillospiraceae bacterium]|nr:phosphate acyltransferase PlsX [Oscillospiraceae bacterium]
GGEKDLLSELNRLGFTDTSRVEIVHAPDAITGDDKPTDAIRLKKESSMMKAISILRTDESVAGLVSTGATGALVAAATLRIGRIRGIRRPAFCPILPTMKGGIVGLCDSGANVDIIPDQLREFAIMGSRYLETVFDIKNPRVAMLNVGTEREKGDDLRKTAYPLLENEPSINFVGNMESRDLLTGKYDLVVCDGFSGNVLTKTTEGTALEMLKMIKRDIQKSWKYKLGALLMKKMLMAEKNFMDYQNYGGSVLLGSEKVIVKGHGSSDASSVLKCIEQAYRMELSGLNDKIMESIKEEANV